LNSLKEFCAEAKSSGRVIYLFIYVYICIEERGYRARGEMIVRFYRFIFVYFQRGG